MFLLYRASQPNFLQNDFKEDYPPFHWNFLLITGLTYTFYKCKYPSQNYHRDSWNISFSSENNVVLLFKLVFILKNTPHSSNHLMYKLTHTVFPALFVSQSLAVLQCVTLTTNPIMRRLMTTKYFPLYITYSKKVKLEAKYLKIRRIQYATCIPFL